MQLVRFQIFGKKTCRVHLIITEWPKTAPNDLNLPPGALYSTPIQLRRKEYLIGGRGLEG